MATTKQMQAQIDRLEAQIAALIGVRAQPPSAEPTERPDYIAHGSAEHAVFLGLIIVPDDEIEIAREDRYVLFTSRETGTTYRLLDELTILRYYPSIDPEKAALTVLRHYVNEFESGQPKVPETAPEMWQPAPALY